MIRRLYVLYDARCGLCSRMRVWIQQQPQFVAYDFVPAGSPRALQLFPTLALEATPSELRVITDQGAVYVQDGAWILCLWGLRAYRAWSYRLARQPLRPLARAAWDLVSSNRRRLSDLLSLQSDENLARELQERSPSCEPDQDQ